MSDPRGWPWTDATPPMPLIDALQVASRRSARPVAAVWSARFVSAAQLAHRAAEKPALAGSRGFAPHWRITFAGREALVDEGHGPSHLIELGDDDDVLVFADGSVMTFFELTDGD
jgi:hypothetical protein